MKKTNMEPKAIQDYTALAATYDELRYVTPQQIFLDTLRHEAVRTCLVPNRNMTVLDVGTGTGSGVVFFAQSVRQMVGLDGTRAMLARARAKLQARGITNVELVHANALHIPYADSTFDNVISLNFIHLFAPLVDRQQAFVAEMERVCRPGGKVIVEFDNAMYLELGNKYADLPRMSESMRLDRILGTYLPRTAALHSTSAYAAGLYGRAAASAFLTRYAYKWVVQFTKQ
jgi:ubiquinone/menaquinone biosynthesis C-methylase UbiE